MTPNSPEILRDRGRSLEDEFFHRENQQLLKRLNELKAAETTREALARCPSPKMVMGLRPTLHHENRLSSPRRRRPATSMMFGISSPRQN